MRKNFVSPAVLIIALIVGFGLTVAVTLVYRNVSTAKQQVDHNPISILMVLHAHIGHSDKSLSSFAQRATMRFHPEIPPGSQQEFERKLMLSIDRSFSRFDKATVNGSQSYLLDGHTLVRTTFDAETLSEVILVDGVEAASVRFQVTTCGLLPILRRLAEPSAHVVYAGRTTKGDQFQVTTAGGSWYFYANSNHLIDRLDVNDISITYGDYRSVEGLTLPFSQKVRKGDKLLYEIRFDAFDLKPVFAPGYFKSDLQ